MSYEPSTSSGPVRRSSRPPVRRVLDSTANNFQDNLYDLVHEILEDELDEDIDDSDQDPDYLEESDHDSKSEQSADECGIEEVSRCSAAYLLSTNNYINRTTSDLTRPIKRQFQTTTIQQSNPSNKSKLNKSCISNKMQHVQPTIGESRLSPSRPLLFPEISENVDRHETSPDSSITSETSGINTPVIYDSVVNELTPSTDPEEINFIPITNSEAPTPNTLRDGQFYYGRRTKEMMKKKIPPFRWRKNAANQAVRTRADNIITQLPGLKAKARDLGTNPDIEEIWHLLISNDILAEIVRWTNVKINTLRQRYDRKHCPSFVHDMDEIELKGFIGLLVYSAAFKAGNESVHSLFATDGTGREIFRVVMSKERFLFILQALRFDNPEGREERRKETKEAAIASIFYKFVDNCQACYTVGEGVCIDEMLVPFRGRCAFKMYMPKKPAKYGLKIQCLADAKTHYFFNGYIYTGKNSDGRGLTEQQVRTLLIPTQVVLRLIKPIENSKRNLTADNWYSSIQLVEELHKRGITYVGTLKKNKNEIPESFLPSSKREERSCMYGFTENITLISYVPKKSKAVILVSSMHHGHATDDISGKPEIIAEYNRTKGGVDTIDMMCSNYSSSRRTQRWPMVVFFTIVNIASGVNAYVLYNAYKNTTPMTRLDFMKSLALKLVTPLMQRRLQKGHLSQDIQLSFKRILQVEDRPFQGRSNAVEILDVKKTCNLCPPKLKRKTRYICKCCARPICLECSKKICVDCMKDIPARPKIF